MRGVRDASLHTNEQLAGECEVVAVGPHHADAQRRLAHTLVEDRELMLRAALMLRIIGAAG